MTTTEGPPVWIVRMCVEPGLINRLLTPWDDDSLRELEDFVPAVFQTDKVKLHHLKSLPTYDIGRGVEFHRDIDYMPAWVVGIALTKSTPENGSIRFVKPEHEQRFYDEVDCPDCKKAWPCCEYDCPRLMTDTFQPGDLWAFRAETWHGVAANFTTETREVAYFRFCEPGSKMGVREGDIPPWVNLSGENSS